MDEQKLVQLIQDQRPVPGGAFDRRIARTLDRLARETLPMKKKVSVLAVCVAVLLSLALLAAAAELMGLNLFERFGRDDARLARLAPRAVLNEVSPMTITSAALGTTEAGIHSAYYDGRSLIIAYAIRNGSQAEPFTPTREQLARMTRLTSMMPAVDIFNPQARALAQQWDQAVRDGTPFGYATCSISPSDHTVTAEGIDLPPSSENHLDGEDGAAYAVREFESPLPEGARDQEKLSVSIGLYRAVRQLYFDGRDAYEYAEHSELAPMQATIWRADAQVKRFAGDFRFAGHPVAVTVLVSAAHAQMTLTMQDGNFPQLPADAWYGLYLRDEQQTELRPQEGHHGGGPVISIPFDGTGRVPDALEMQLRVDREDGVQIAPELQTPVFLTLTPA